MTPRNNPNHVIYSNARFQVLLRQLFNSSATQKKKMKVEKKNKNKKKNATLPSAGDGFL